MKVFLNEFTFLLSTLSQFKTLSSENTKTITLKTTLGVFLIRDICADINIASPSFERQDLNELFRRLQQSLNQNRRVVFIDIGASFGKFTVAVGNQFKAYRKQLSILSFEPDQENFRLLKENVRLNKLKNVKIFRTALSDKKTHQNFYYFRPMRQVVSFPTREKIMIQTTTLDKHLPYIPKGNDVDIFIKIDVEGHEVNVLKGSKKIFSTYRNIILLIEDSMDTHSKKLLRYLLMQGTYITKKTSYNSFWQL